MKTKAKTDRPVKLTLREREEELRAFVGLCFASLDDDLKEISNLTHLSLSTLSRYRRGQVSLRCQFRSIQALGYAARMRLELNDYRARVILLD